MNTWDLLVNEPMWFCMLTKGLGLCLEQKRKVVAPCLFPFVLLYLHFICLPVARPSSELLWGAEGVFSSLTNMVQIAGRMTMGEHLDLRHTLFVAVALAQPIQLSFFLCSPQLCLRASVK